MSLPPPVWFMRLRRLVDAATTVLNVAGTLLILAIMVLVNADVIGRSAFHAPVSGVPEMVSMSIVAIVFLQLAQTFRSGRLTRTEAVLNLLRARAPRLSDALEILFALGAVVLIWQLFSASRGLFVKAWTRGTFEGTIGDFTMPIWPVKLIILIGCLALIAQLVLFAGAAGFRLAGRKEQP